MLPNGNVLVTGDYNPGLVPAYLNRWELHDVGLGFTNSPGARFSVLASTNPTQPASNWTVLSGVTEVSPGQFQFTDLQVTNAPRRFYRIRSQ